MTEDIHRTKRMFLRLLSLGDKSGSPLAGELAQLLARNALWKDDKIENTIRLCSVEGGATSRGVPLSKAVSLFHEARQELVRPFESRDHCLQSCLLDALLCNISFWGQLYEYYEIMYYKPAELSDGTTDSTPATVPFDIGWKVACLFIREMGLSAAARSAGVSSGYDRTLSWFYYPANQTSELEDAKSLLLAVICAIRKRGVALVSKEGMVGHIAHSYSPNLRNWLEDNLDKNWNDTDRLNRLCDAAFETSSVRLTVSVNPITKEPTSPEKDALNASFGPDSSFLDGLDISLMEGVDLPVSLLSSRAITLSIRPITPVVFVSESVDWSGIEMGDFCRSVVSDCLWPEVVNTVSTVGQIGITVLSMKADVVLKPPVRSSRRSSLSAPSRISVTPEKDLSLPFPIPTPVGMPKLEPLFQLTTPPPTEAPRFGTFANLPIPQLTPTPVRAERPRMNRDSDVTFCGDARFDTPVSPLERAAHAGGALVALPSDVDLDPPQYSFSPRAKMSRPSETTSAPAPVKASLAHIAQAICGAANRDLSAAAWSVESALGDLARNAKSLESLYAYVLSSQPVPNQNASTSNAGRKRKKSASPGKQLEALNELPKELLKESDEKLRELLDIVVKRSLRSLSSAQKGTLHALSRVLLLTSLLHTGSACSETTLKSLIAVAADFVCFAHSAPALIAPTDVFAAGLRGLYVNIGIAIFEVVKDLDFFDWFSLALYYNETAFLVLMGPDTGLFTPNSSHSGPPAARGGSQRLVAPHMSIFEQLPNHCRLVCSELMMRWAWAPTSRIWQIHQKLVMDFQSRRHFGVDHSIQSASESEIGELNYFVKECLAMAGLDLCDLADRLGVSGEVTHCAFDLIRATLLLRPEMLKGRHMYVIVYAALMTASAVLSGSAGGSLEISRVAQAALVMQKSAEAKEIVQKFVVRSVTLSNLGGAILFSDMSAPLVLPPPSRVKATPPEYEFVGDIRDFYEKIFVPEMQQTVFNLMKFVEEPAAIGPFVEGYGRAPPSLSPFAFASLSSAFTVGVGHLLNGPNNVQTRAFRYHLFASAMPLISPMGALPCLTPPETAAGASGASGRRKDRYFKWFTDTVIQVSDNGLYAAIPVSSGD